MRYTKKIIALQTIVIVVLSLFNVSVVSASAANISHSYQSDTSIQVGSLVSLNISKPGYVVAANLSNGTNLIGVAVNGNDSLLAVDETANKVQVATSGIASTLVSNLNGQVEVGDEIAASPLDGIGMKALPGDTIIGVAQTPLSDTKAISEQVKNKDGQATEVKVGYVNINIGVTPNAAGSSTQLNQLQRLVKSFTGKTVSTVRIILGLSVTVIALVALITLIYAAIYGTIISVGRNPLARKDIFRTLMSVLGMAAATAAVAGIADFLLLA